MIIEQEFKCTNCGGDKFRPISYNTYKCAYCGQFLTVSSQHRGPQIPPQQQNYQPRPMYPDIKSKSTAIIFAFFLGGFGVHKFYLRQSGLGVLYLLFCWTYIPGFIAFIEAIILLAMSDQEFNLKYNPTI